MMEGVAYLVPDVEVVDQRVASGGAGAVVRHQWYVREAGCVGHGEGSEGCERRKVEVEKAAVPGLTRLVDEGGGGSSRGEPGVIPRRCNKPGRKSVAECWGKTTGDRDKGKVTTCPGGFEKKKQTLKSPITPDPGPRARHSPAGWYRKKQVR